MTPEYKLYAIGLKGWVEIRKAKTPPRARISSFKIKGEERKFLTWAEWGGAGDPWKMVPKTTTVKVTNFVGGRVLKAVSKRRFAALIGISPKVGEMIEIPPELASVSLLDKVMERDYD